MTDFSTVPLAQTARLFSGGTPSKAEPSFWSGPIPWLTPKDMAQWDGSTEEAVSQAAIGNGTRLAPEGAVFITVRGMSLHNEIRIVRSNSALTFNQDIKAIVAKDGVDGRFLYYALTAKKRELLESVEAAGHGTGRLPTDRLESIAVPCISPVVQVAISSCLGAFDDKIELNRRMNESLEAMARTIFKDWFIDFGPTRAKMEGRPPYLAQETWSLFPNRLDDEGKPQGWTASTVGTEFLLTMGQSPPGDTYNESGEGMPFFQGRTDFGSRYPRRRMYCTAPTRLANQDDTLVSVRAPVGDLNLAWEKCCIGRGVASLRHRSGVRGYTFHALSSIQNDLAAYEHTGTVFGAINKLQFEALKIIAPQPGIVAAFEETVAPLDGQIRLNETEDATLAQTRDLLLPKLMSGEVRVKNAQKIAEAAV